MTEITFDPQEVSAARTEVARQLGTELAEKATDTFCVTHYRWSVGRAVRFGLEAMAPAPVASVVEFRPTSPSSPMPPLTRRTDAAQVSETLDSIVPAGAPVRVPTALR